MKTNKQDAKNSQAQLQNRDAASSNERRLFEELKRRFQTNDDWIFISDYHADFYQLALDPEIYGYNVECEVWVGGPNGGTRLPWIDIYAGQEESDADADGQATNTASGFEGGNQPSGAAESLIVVETKDGAPKIVFDPAVDERQVNVCYPQTGRLFGKTVRECARAWAEIKGYSVPLERVVVCTANPFEDDEVDETTFFNEFVALNPELAVKWGFAPEDLFERRAEEARQREEASRIPQITGVNVSPEVLEQMRQNMSPEQFAQTLAWIESMNAAAAQNAENQDEAAE
ncbi:MAG: hypothetical protein J6K25_07560 [Thermoguttaceae bacterium]|nr:hypothetical protein [Thermoguttaceae bacterium]